MSSRSSAMPKTRATAEFDMMCFLLPDTISRCDNNLKIMTCLRGIVECRCLSRIENQSGAEEVVLWLDMHPGPCACMHVIIGVEHVHIDSFTLSTPLYNPALALFTSISYYQQLGTHQRQARFLATAADDLPYNSPLQQPLACLRSSTSLSATISFA